MERLAEFKTLIHANLTEKFQVCLWHRCNGWVNAPPQLVDHYQRNSRNPRPGLMQHTYSISFL